MPPNTVDNQTAGGTPVGTDKVLAYRVATGTISLTVAGLLAYFVASPTFTGVPAAPTAAPGTNTTQLATTAFVTAAVSGGGYTDEQAQDAVGAMVNASLTYTDGTPLLTLADRDYTDFTCATGGTVCNLDTDSVGTNEIATDGVGTAEIATGAVGSLEIGTDAVNDAEIVGNAVRTAEIQDGQVAYADLADGSALSAMGRSANSSGVRADISATAGAYGALRERGSALSFRRESFQALTASGTGTVTVTFTVATSPNATIANSVAEAHSLVINAVSPVDGEQGFVVVTNASSGEPFDDTPTFNLNGSATNVSHFGDVMQDGNDDITVYRWLFDGTRLIVWVAANTAPPA